jgi:anti-anti-sigma factor
MMEFAQRQAGDVVIVRLSGRLDSSAAPPAEESFAQLPGACHLVIDLSALEYLSSAGLRVLLVAAKRAQRANRKLVLFGLRPTVREIFAISRFDQIFTIRADEPAALATVG